MTDRPFKIDEMTTDRKFNMLVALFYDIAEKLGGTEVLIGMLKSRLSGQNRDGIRSGLPKSIRDWGFVVMDDNKMEEPKKKPVSAGLNERDIEEVFGMWKDRNDISDSVEYVNALRGSIFER